MDREPIVAKYRAFIEQEVLPLEADFLRTPFKQLLPAVNAVRQKAKTTGLWAPHLPTSMGGQGITLQGFAHLSREMGRSPLGHYVFNCQAPDIGNMELLLEHGSATQQEQYLRPLAEGRIRSCFSMTEPHFAGSNPVRMGTTARKDGNHYVINGRKWFTTAADGAAFAIVMAVTDAHTNEVHRRASQIIVPTDTPGFKLVRNISVMGESGEDYFSHAEVEYTDVRVPIANRIGEEGAGFALAQQRLGPGRIHHCMRWIGIAERALEQTVRRAAQRELKEGQVLAEMQSIQHSLAESYAALRASQMLVLDVARRVDTLGHHALSDAALRDDISLIKFYVAGMLCTLLDRCVQVHGALGMTDDTLLAFWYRHERAARIYDGPDEVHKSVVARGLFKQMLKKG
jgi:alkylation response protein AidB-like acyl-CoA dehydrogenase